MNLRVPVGFLVKIGATTMVALALVRLCRVGYWQQTREPMDHKLSLDSFSSSSSSSLRLGWHINPIKPLHRGKAVFLSEQSDTGDVVYKRIFTAPCAYGM